MSAPFLCICIVLESVAYLYSLWTNVFVCAGLGVACCESVGCGTTLELPAVVVLLLLLLLLPTTGVNEELWCCCCECCSSMYCWASIQESRWVNVEGAADWWWQDVICTRHLSGRGKRGSTKSEPNLDLWIISATQPRHGPNPTSFYLDPMHFTTTNVHHITTIRQHDHLDVSPMTPFDRSCHHTNIQETCTFGDKPRFCPFTHIAPIIAIKCLVVVGCWYLFICTLMKTCIINIHVAQVIKPISLDGQLFNVTLWLNPITATYPMSVLSMKRIYHFPPSGYMDLASTLERHSHVFSLPSWR